MIKFNTRASTLAMLVVLGFLGSPIAQAGELQDAVKAGDVARVQAALAGGANANEPDLNGTALHTAAALGSEEVTTALIDAGAALEAEGDPASAHPLHVAAKTNQAAAATLLVERGAQVDVWWRRLPAGDCTSPVGHRDH